MTPKEFLADKKNEIVELQTLLTSIPAIAQKESVDGEKKKQLHWKTGSDTKVLKKLSAMKFLMNV